jgi:hypothetical protein
MSDGKPVPRSREESIVTSRVCCVCGHAELPKALDPIGDSELRPYGPGSAPICFACAMRPENRAETDRQFDQQLAAAEKIARGATDQIAHVELTKEGPRPLKKGTS